tara:strand:- start:602 stop:1117 length:516 start_codon:yes stop_codon:yes gene_type:complete
MAIHKIDGVDAVDGGSLINSFPKKYVTLVADGTITKDDWVAIGTGTDNGLGANVVAADSGTVGHQSLIFGVATESATDGQEVKIQTAGKYTNGANVHADTIYGDALVASSTAGRAYHANQLATDSDANDKLALNYAICGVALEADATGTDDAGATMATNKASVMIVDRGFF